MNTIRAMLAGAAPGHRRDLEVLLCHVLGQPRAWLYSHGDDRLDAATLQRTNRLRLRLLEGEPVAYIVGEREFWGLTFEVGPDVLIPRPETELIVELALNRMATNASVVDLGTGAGAIAIAVAKERPDCAVTATDSSEKALRIARANAARHGVNIDFVQCDWLEGLARFDLILSNPPYVAQNDPHLAALRFEPVTALVAGAEGLDAIRDIVATAPAHIAPGGHLIVEHGFDQGAAVRSFFDAAGLKDIATFSDLGGRERATLGAR